MAATAVLRSQDCLRHPHRLHSETRGNTGFYPNTNSLRSRRRKRSPTGLAPNGRDECRNRVPDRKDHTLSVKNLVMGQVKILKRGESLPEKIIQQARTTPADTTPVDKLGFVGRNDDELILCSTDRLGPDPDMVQKQIRASDFYAGSGPIVASPPPSSLPFPALLAKKERKSDAATMDLLRLLRLDLP